MRPDDRMGDIEHSWETGYKDAYVKSNIQVSLSLVIVQILVLYSRDVKECPHSQETHSQEFRVLTTDSQMVWLKLTSRQGEGVAKQTWQTLWEQEGIRNSLF